MSSSTLQSTGEQRLHPVGMLLVALGTVRRWIGLAAFPGIAALLNGDFGMRALSFVALAAALLAAISLVWGVLAWRATTYRVSGGAFHLKRGVLQKSERSLPLERIQSVETVQGIVQRLFGVVEVRVEAAGGGGEPEISLPALSRSAARALREDLSATRQSSEPIEEPAPTILRKLSVRYLFLAGLTSGQIGVAASVLAGASQTAREILPRSLAERVSEVVLPRTVLGALLLILAIAMLAWLLAILGTLLAHAGFTLSRSADGRYLYIKRGLLERHEATVPLARIQAIRVVEGILRQPLGLASLRVESAGFGGERGVSTTLFPLLPRKEVEELLSHAVRFETPLERLEPLPRRALRRYAFRATVPVLIFSALCSILFYPWSLFTLLLLIPAALYGFLHYRAGGYGMVGDRLVLRFRRLARTTVISPAARLQSRGYSISPFQRRSGLATLEVEVAAGSGGKTFRLADVEEKVAAELVEALSEHHRPTPNSSVE